MSNVERKSQINILCFFSKEAKGENRTMISPNPHAWLQGFPGSLTPLWPHDADGAEEGWIIFSRRFIIRSCSCRHWTWRRFCWCKARRTSLHVSSMARLDLFCCCSMACITRSFFLFMNRCLLACLFLAEVGWELEKREGTFLEQAVIMYHEKWLPLCYSYDLKQSSLKCLLKLIIKTNFV